MPIPTLKKKFILWLIFLSATNFLSAQSFDLKGLIVNENNSALLYVNIKQIPKGNRFKTNTFGAFQLKANIGDTLIFDVIGYRSDTLFVNFYEDTTVRIVLKRRGKKVKSFDARMDSMAREVALLLKTDLLLNDYTKIEKWPGKKIEIEPITLLIAPGIELLLPGIQIRGLFNTIWYKYSDRGEEMQKLLYLLDLYREQQKADEKFNINFVMRNLNCTEKEAENILLKCRLANSFILKANEYDLIVALKKCK